MRVTPKVDEKRAAPSDIISPQGLHLYYVTLLPTEHTAPENSRNDFPFKKSSALMILPN